MTHSLHRRGDRESLGLDYVVFTMSAKGINEAGSGDKMKDFFDILLRYQPVNYGDMVTGNSYVKSPEEIRSNIGDTSIVHGVFTESETVAEILQELKEANLGMSVVVTGIHDETEACCQKSGLEKHTIEHSLGVFGRLRVLPSDEILQLTTMCGHGMVPANLVERMVMEIKRGKKTFREGALELTRPCHCGIYNPVRAERLLRGLVPLMVLN